MIRAARTTDVFAIADIMIGRLDDSRFAGLAMIEPKLARQMFAQAVQRHGGTTDGATFLMVNETDGEIDAFLFASLGRIYGVSDTLCATDNLLLGKKGCDPLALLRLVRAYIAWSEGNPKVAETSLSWADTIEGSEEMSGIYERMGFALCSATYRRDNPNFAIEERMVAA